MTDAKTAASAGKSPSVDRADPKDTARVAKVVTPAVLRNAVCRAAATIATVPRCIVGVDASDPANILHWTETDAPSDSGDSELDNSLRRLFYTYDPTREVLILIVDLKQPFSALRLEPLPSITRCAACGRGHSELTPARRIGSCLAMLLGLPGDEFDVNMTLAALRIVVTLLAPPGERAIHLANAAQTCAAVARDRKIGHPRVLRYLVGMLFHLLVRKQDAALVLKGAHAEISGEPLHYLAAMVDAVAVPATTAAV